jgi:hypothetical protein
VVLFFQVTLFGNTELDNYKYYNSSYLFVVNLYMIIEKRLFLRYFIPAKYLDKLIDYIYFKVAND